MCKSLKQSYGSIIWNLSHEKLSLLAVWAQAIAGIDTQSIAHGLQHQATLQG